jgi:hypothetical protein
MKKFFQILGVVVLILILSAVFFYFRYQPSGNTDWGLTFSYREAQGLGFDWKTVYLDMLNDLKPKKLRLMAYWEDIERERGKFDFTIVDQIMIEAQKRSIDVVMVVGRKQPRWPECHEPDWFRSLSKPDQNQAVLNMVKMTTEHLKVYGNIKAWQVENEPYFGFGSCATIDHNLFNQEVKLVRSIDSRPVVATDSGDRGAWIPVARSGADVMGFTLYRLSYDKRYGGFYKYPIPSWFYRVRAGMLQAFAPNIKEIWDVELQLEPWFTNGALNSPLSEQRSLMNPKIFAENVAYAKKTGISEHYLWGVEWWYWMAKKNNDWGMWEAAKNLLKN